MRRACFAAGAAAVCMVSGARADHVYILSSGDTTVDAAVVAALTTRGHTVVVGVQYVSFDGSVPLAGFNAVYLQTNANWALGDMPAAGQQQLVDYVMAGGRLTTCEWALWKVAVGTTLQTLGPILPAVPSTSYGGPSSVTYARVTANAAINAGVPTAFTFPVNNYGGTEVFTVARQGATVFYSSDGSPGIVGLTGWTRGTGSVFSFSTTCGPTQLADSNFGRLFANVVGAEAGSGCYPNCDGSTIAPILNVNDFICFLTTFGQGLAYANCDASTIPPVLNVNDFVCFTGRFAAGCP